MMDWCARLGRLVKAHGLSVAKWTGLGLVGLELGYLLLANALLASVYSLVGLVTMV
jgi:hypothetical protein